MHGIRIVASWITLSAAVACARPPASSTPADADAIRHATQEWTAAIRAGDVERMVAALTADAMGDVSVPVRGRLREHVPGDR